MHVTERETRWRRPRQNCTLGTLKKTEPRRDRKTHVHGPGAERVHGEHRAWGQGTLLHNATVAMSRHVLQTHRVSTQKGVLLGMACPAGSWAAAVDHSMDVDGRGEEGLWEPYISPVQLCWEPTMTLRDKLLIF